jgi:hypothetical protein
LLISLGGVYARAQQIISPDSIFKQNVHLLDNTLNNIMYIESQKAPPIMGLQNCEYNLLPAIDIIDSISKNADIIFLSERHNIPNHRLFAKTLCKVLYKNGYEIICLEATNRKENTNNVQFPYSITDVIPLGAEPCYYELAYIANKIGMQNYSFTNNSDEITSRDTFENGKKTM